LKVRLVVMGQGSGGKSCDGWEKKKTLGKSPSTKEPGFVSSRGGGLWLGSLEVRDRQMPQRLL